MRFAHNTGLQLADIERRGELVAPENNSALELVIKACLSTMSDSSATKSISVLTFDLFDTDAIGL
jgi:hypothetical protein